MLHFSVNVGSVVLVTSPDGITAIMNKVNTTVSGQSCNNYHYIHCDIIQHVEFVVHCSHQE